MALPQKGRFLVVNADDLGWTEGINAGIVEAYERGIVTSTSLMVRGRAAAQAASTVRGCPALAVGLHVDLGEWVYQAGEWRQRYAVVDIEDRDAVRAEVARQLAAFEAIVGRPPSHVDSHQHVHRHEPVAGVLVEAAQRLGVPLRHHGHVEYCGSFYGQTARGEPCHDAITVDALVDLIRRLRRGVTEVGCHPGRGVTVEESTYAQERAHELEALCDARVGRAIVEAGVELITFRDVAAVAGLMR